MPVARGHLDRLREEAERAGVQAEREKQAWERARNIGTADALNEYLAAFPAGAHAAEARAAIQAAERARRDEEAYGVAKASGVVREAETQANALIGSYLYMSPERLDRKDSDQPAGDIYALGAVLFECA